MRNIMNATELNDSLNDIWQATECTYIPHYFRKPTENQFEGLLTVGGNPSFAEQNIKNFVVSTNNTGDWRLEHFKWETKPSDAIDLSNAEEDYSLVNHSTYFGAFEELRKELNAPPWLHTDLFRCRGTSQKEMYKFLNQNPKFKKAQISLFGKYLTSVRPKLILVANAAASRIILNHLDMERLDSPSLYETKIEGQRVPVILSGMISGGRMDIYSKERLFSLVKKAWKTSTY